MPGQLSEWCGSSLALRPPQLSAPPPAVMAAPDVHSNQALLQEGLRTDIFAQARARSAMPVDSPPNPASDSSSSSHASAGTAGLTVSGLLATAASEAMPAMMRWPDVSVAQP